MRAKPAGSIAAMSSTSLLKSLVSTAFSRRATTGVALATPATSSSEA